MSLDRVMGYCICPSCGEYGMECTYWELVDGSYEVCDCYSCGYFEEQKLE